jgi:hypothetical protein
VRGLSVRRYYLLASFVGVVLLSFNRSISFTSEPGIHPIFLSKESPGFNKRSINNFASFSELYSIFFEMKDFFRFRVIFHELINIPFILTDQSGLIVNLLVGKSFGVISESFGVINRSIVRWSIVPPTTQSSPFRIFLSHVHSSFGRIISVTSLPLSIHGMVSGKLSKFFNLLARVVLITVSLSLSI